MNRLVMRSLRAGKMHHVLVMLSIILATTLLMALGALPGSYSMEQKRELAHEGQAHFIGVQDEQIQQLENHSEIEAMTLYKTGSLLEVDDYRIYLAYYDADSEQIKTMSVIEGRAPQQTHEIAVSKPYLERLGKEPRVGAEISLTFLDGTTETFTVSGLVNERARTSTHPIYVSKAYADQGKQLEKFAYNAIIRVKGADNLMPDSFSNKVQLIADDAGIPHQNISENGFYVNLLKPNTTNLLAAAGISVVVLIASALVIYSTFYISVIGKIREYGQLATIGTTQRQIRRLLKKEGTILCIIAIPIGLLLGGIVTYLIIPAGWSWTNELFVMLITIVLNVITVRFAIHKPAKLAATVSPVEAANYSAYSGIKEIAQTKKLHRRMTTFRLAAINFSRNRKKTIITIISLCLGGTLFMAIATWNNAMDIEKFARNEFDMPNGQFLVKLSSNAIQTTDHGKSGLQLANPLSDQLAQQIIAIPGVQKIVPTESFNVSFRYLDNQEDWTTAAVITQRDMQQINQELLEGPIDYEQLVQQHEIIVRGNETLEKYYGGGFQVGDTVRLKYYNGQMVEKEFRVAGTIVEGGGTDGWFLFPQQTAHEMMKTNINSQFEIVSDPSQEAAVYASLYEIIGNSSSLKIDRLKDRVSEVSVFFSSVMMVFFGLTLFIVVFSVINLINTIVTNVMTRKHEFALLQAVGMTRKQLSFMIQGESMLLAAGNVILSTLFGGVLGYVVYEAMAKQGADFYMTYRFPTWYLLGYVLFTVMIPVIISYLTTRSLEKESVMEQL
ncbi:ABC transporter permease [Paenibacillus marinisediminis]